MTSNRIPILRRYLREAGPFEDPKQEADFLTFYRRPGLIFMRIALVLGIGAYGFFFAMEALYPAAATSASAQTTRLFMIGILVVLYYLMAVRADWMLSRLVWIGGPSCFLVLVFTASLIRSYGPETYRAAWSVMGSVMFATFLMYGLSRFPLKATAVICVSGAAVLLYFSPDHIDSPSWLLRMAAQLALANIAGALMMTISERRERSLFIQTLKLNEAGASLAESARAASEASEMKTRLLAGVSHDMRQPMTGLAAHASLLARAPRQLTIAEVRQRGARMETVLLAMDAQLQKLLDIARTRSDTEPRTLDRVDVREVLTRVETVYQEHASQAGVALRIRRPPPHTAFLYSQETDLFEALSQLVFNAIKYSRGRKGAKVFVGVRRVGDVKQIVVVDNGVGISHENLDRIFEPYFAVNTNESQRYHGRGLGLAQAKAIVSSLPGHELTVASAAGRGSCFTITGPHAPLFAASESPLGLKSPRSLQSVESLRGTYFLLVDDDVTVSAALTDVLQSAGVLVDCRGSYEAGLHALRTAERDYDGLVVDYRLDENNTGLQLIAEAHQVMDPAPPAVLISGDVSTIRRMEPLPHNTRFVPKPVAPSQLLGALLESLEDTRTLN